MSSLMRDTNSARTEAVEATLREPGAAGAEVGKLPLPLTLTLTLILTLTLTVTLP